MTNKTLETITSLRSVHWVFDDKKVSRGDVEKIISCSLHPANNSDRTDTTVIVVDDAELLNEITHGESGGKSATALIYCLDYNRIIKCAEILGYDPSIPKNWNRLYHFLYGMYDISASVSAAVIAAKSMGIDSLVTNFTHRHDLKRIKERLNLPAEYCFPVMQVVLGYTSAEDLKPRIISTEGVIHYNAYKPIDENHIQALIKNMDDNYAEYINDKYKHAIGWYFSEWWTAGNDESAYQMLAEEFNKTKLLREPYLYWNDDYNLMQCYVYIPVNDFEKSTNWYNKILGFDLVLYDPIYRELRSPSGVRVMLIERHNDINSHMKYDTGAQAAYGFTVKGIEEYRSMLISKGVNITEIDHYQGKSFSFFDLDGNKIELWEEKC